jgi:hypothetical protein
LIRDYENLFMATVIVGNNPFWGMVLYERRGDGSLCGTWKNNGLSNDSILNEIVRKTDNTITIEGIYTVSWIEENNQAHAGTLEIRQIESNTALSFIWRENEIELFRGMGMPIGLDQIAVTYWNTQGTLRLGF